MFKNFDVDAFRAHVLGDHSLTSAVKAAADRAGGGFRFDFDHAFPLPNGRVFLRVEFPNARPGFSGFPGFVESRFDESFHKFGPAKFFDFGSMDSAELFDEVFPAESAPAFFGR